MTPEELDYARIAEARRQLQLKPGPVTIDQIAAKALSLEHEGWTPPPKVSARTLAMQKYLDTRANPSQGDTLGFLAGVEWVAEQARPLIDELSALLEGYPWAGHVYREVEAAIATFTSAVRGEK